MLFKTKKEKRKRKQLTENIMEMEPFATPVIPELNLCQPMKQAAKKRSSWMGYQDAWSDLAMIWSEGYF